MNRFFRYDYKYKIFILMNFLSLLFLGLTIVTIWDDQEAWWLFGATALYCVIVNFTNIKNQGIRIKNDKVIINDIDVLGRGHRIELSKVKAVELKEIKKEKKSNLYGFFHEFYHSYTYIHRCDYVYNHGRVFMIVFYLIDGSRRETYFGWMYREKDEKTVEKVTASLESFVKDLNDYVKKLVFVHDQLDRGDYSAPKRAKR